MNTQEYKIRNFLRNQENLDVMTYFSKGESFEQIAKRINRTVLSVRSKVGFLRKNKLMLSSGWNIDINALGMVKTLEFCGCTGGGWDKLFERDFFLSYFSQIEVGKPKYLAMYTFPNEVKNKIGCEITSWYYTFPHFKEPFFGFKSKEEFSRLYEKEDNRSTLPPRGERIKDPDLVDLYICRYIQLEAYVVNLEKYAERMKKEIGDITDVSSRIVEEHFQLLKEKNIIYRVIPLDFSSISHSLVYCIVSQEIAIRLMKTLNKLNMITGISFINEERTFLYFQCPLELKYTIVDIFDEVDEENEIYFVREILKNRGIPYKYYLEKHKKGHGKILGGY